MINKDEVIGNSRRNLVLKTAGIIRVLVGDKYYNINFRSSEEEQEDKDEEITSSFIIANNIRDYEDGTLEYPGEKRIIFTLDGGIYRETNFSLESLASKEFRNFLAASRSLLIRASSLATSTS